VLCTLEMWRSMCVADSYLDSVSPSPKYTDVWKLKNVNINFLTFIIANNPPTNLHSPGLSHHYHLQQFPSLSRRSAHPPCKASANMTPASIKSQSQTGQPSPSPQTSPPPRPATLPALRFPCECDVMQLFTPSTVTCTSFAPHVSHCRKGSWSDASY